MTSGAVELIDGAEPARAEMSGPWVDSPFFAAELARRPLSEADRRLALAYHDDGYVLLPGLVDAETCDRLREEIAPLFRASITPRFSAGRVHDAWTTSPGVRAVASHPRVMSLLAMLYGRRPLPFQTLNFPVGTQQAAHSDSIHFSCLPARYMCGVWVALEDVDPDSGPLFYYPGSHRLPELDYQDLGLPTGLLGPSYDAYEAFIQRLMETSGFEQHRLVVRQGDGLVWSSNLIHGGSPILRGGSSRWSQVTHYFFEDCVYFTPMLSNRVTGELALRNNLVDIASGEPIVHSYQGSTVLAVEAPDGRYRIALADGGDPS